MPRTKAIDKSKEIKETEKSADVEKTKPQKKQSKALQYLWVAVLLALILFIVFYALYTKGFFEKKINTLELEGLVFVSDENIVEKLIDVKDSNKIYIYGTINKDRSNLMAVTSAQMLYIQIFSALRKEFATYTLYEENGSCSVFDSDKNKRGRFDQAHCENVINNTEYVILILNDPTLEKPKVVLENNIIYFYSKSNDDSLNDHHSFLKVIVPNLDFIEQKIREYMGTIGDKLS